MTMHKNSAIGKYAVIILSDSHLHCDQQIELCTFAKTKAEALAVFESYKKTAERFNAKNSATNYAPFVLNTKELIEDLIDDNESGSFSTWNFLAGMCEVMYGDFSTEKRHNPVKYDKYIPGKNVLSLSILHRKWARYREEWV